MEYRYHCQHAAEATANTILPVPEKYPLADGLPDDFREHFSQLCVLMKNMYLDMAKQPSAYGLVLTDYALQGTDSQSKERGLVLKSRNSVNRLPDTLFRLSQSGEVCNHQLIISLPVFKESLKQTESCIVSPVSKYHLILSRLVDFGFTISDFNGKPFGKTINSFTVEYPDMPELIDTLKTFCDYWYEYKVRQSQRALKDRSSLTYKGKPALHYYSHMNFDFRFTADQDKIPTQEWIRYELKSQGCAEERIGFLVAFYEYSLKYTDVMYDGNYFIESKRIAQVHDNFILKLKNPDNYIEEIAAMPKILHDCFAKSSCRFCNFQGATREHCKYRLHWTYNDTSQTGCAFASFAFPDTDVNLVPYYWRLLELEYGLR
ncbi:MAG: hypothetical protein FWC73_07695 [Defluviitaleaceae bacterium]|nr:hypothetical protein [Defluviitaleaceae bacterium]